MVEVFKTNIETNEEAVQIRNLLLELFPNCQINFDLDDCDRVLRIEGTVSSAEVVELVKEHSYRCEVLE